MLILSIILGITTCFCQNNVPDIFIDFGENAGDVRLRLVDDGFSSPITIADNFTFFAASYRTLFVSNNVFVLFVAIKSVDL